ncbi:MAG: carboxylesterase family protein [Clostridia bacterium]|nr:carboxylesterase family protein [Clostridia bacterium]
MIVLSILTVLLLAFMELDQHTLWGWLAVLVIAGVGGFLLIKMPEGTPWYWKALFWVGLFSLWTVIFVFSAAPVRPVPAVQGKTVEQTEIVTVREGKLTGVKTPDGKVELFAGVPYAKPPVGDLRWRAPRDPEPWDGVRVCDTFAPMSMQPQYPPFVNSLVDLFAYHDYTVGFADNTRGPASEDSLYLNIWRPANGGRDLPVLVYVHGGSLKTGQPWYADYSGEGLARDGVIAVNMGYRLGVFGFFADEELQKEDPDGSTGNYGLMDQIQALKWVRENIASFGGDPNNVTLAGESAGSACVSALCTSPAAKGLFRRVVGESSTVTAPKPAHSFRTLENALLAGKKTKELLGCKTVSELRALSAEELLKATDLNHHVTVDGFVLPESPYEAYKEGRFNEEAIFHGFNKTESRLFITFDQASLKNYEEKIRAYFNDRADEVLSLYPASNDREAKDNWTDIYSAAVFSYGHYHWTREALANGIPVYAYYFTKDNKRLGADHGGEEVYFYGNIPPASAKYDQTDRELGDLMHHYFLNFIKNGDPNGEGLPRWEGVSDAARIFEFGDRVGDTAEPFYPLYDVLDRTELP